jgi:FtsZ-binding cell division protein ZapB
MSENQPPDPNVDTFNNLYWLPPEGGSGLSISQADARYLKLFAQQSEDMNSFNINNVALINGVDNTNLPIKALGTGDIQLFTNATAGGAGGTNRLVFRDSGECLADSNGLYIQGATVAQSRIRMGFNAGLTNQGQGSVAIGGEAGFTSQGSNCVALGNQAGITQGNNAIAIGSIGNTQGFSSIAIGSGLSSFSQNSTHIAIGIFAGGSPPGTNLTQSGNSAIAIGYMTNSSGMTQSTGSIAIGRDAGTSQFQQCIAIGNGAGGNQTGTGSIAIGFQAAGSLGPTNTQLSHSIAIGREAAQTLQSLECIAIGYQAGQISQGQQSISIGYLSGQNNQGTGYAAVGDGSISMGYHSAKDNQTRRAIAIGGYAGSLNQGLVSVAIGYQAGQNSQSAGSVCIGNQAGSGGLGLGFPIGANTICIGNQAATTSTLANSIILNASGAAFNPATNQGFYVNPIRATAAAVAMYYTAATGEITYLTSSQRYKTDILDLTSNTSVLHQMRPTEFIYIADGAKGYGFIAEELELLDPLLVYHNEEGLPESIYWDRINLYNICEVQKLKRELDELKAEKDSMKSRLDTLEAEKDSMKSRLDTLEAVVNTLLGKV